MNKNALIIGGIVLAAMVGLPLALGAGNGEGMGHGPGHEPGDRLSDYELPEYAQRMGLNRVPRETFENTFARSPEQAAERLGVEGVLIDHPEDLPPMEWMSFYNNWLRIIESPGERLYFWVNEYDNPMMMAFDDERRIMSYAGPNREAFEE